jgi:hypothetical protein
MHPEAPASYPPDAAAYYVTIRYARDRLSPDCSALEWRFVDAVVVSEQVHGSSGFEEWLLAFHGRPLRRPQRAEYLPAAEHLRWHWKEVFRGPARG